MTSYDFGYSWWLTHGHLVVAVGAAIVALLAWRFHWPRWGLALSILVALWGGMGATFVHLGLERPAVLPTARFLPSGSGRVLDMGAGSGRATLMVLLERPQATVTALDIYSGYAPGRIDAGRRASSAPDGDQARNCRGDPAILICAQRNDCPMEVQPARAPRMRALSMGRLPVEVGARPRRGSRSYRVAGAEPLPPGPVTLRYDFTYDGSGRGKGGLGALLVNGRKVAEGRIERTIPNVFSPDEGATVGVDDETVVTDDYRERNNRFTGTLRKIVVDVK